METVKVQLRNSRTEALIEGYAYKTVTLELELKELSLEQRRALTRIEYDSGNGVYLLDSARSQIPRLHLSAPVIINPNKEAALAFLDAVSEALKKEEAEKAEDARKKAEEHERKVQEYLQWNPEDFITSEGDECRLAVLPKDERLNGLIEAAKEVARKRRAKIAEFRQKTRQAEERREQERDAYISDWIRSHGSPMLQEKARRGYDVIEEVRELVREHTFRVLNNCAKFKRIKASEVCGAHPEDVEFEKSISEIISDREMETVISLEGTIDEAKIDVQEHVGFCQTCWERACRRSVRIGVDTPVGPISRTLALERGGLVPA